MPTIERVGPYRIFFYSHDLVEPPHVHIERDRSVAKIWLNPVAVARTHGFRPNEINQLRKLISERRLIYLEAWNEHANTAR